MSATPQPLFDWLYEQYLASLAKHGVNAELLAVHRQHLQPFRDWAAFYLGENRPVRIEHGQESNYVITLAGPTGTQQQVLVSPPLVAGAMAKSGQVVSLSSPASRGGPNGIQNTGYIQVGGNAVEAAPEAFPGQQETADLTQQEGPIDMTQPHATWPKLY